MRELERLRALLELAHPGTGEAARLAFAWGRGLEPGEARAYVPGDDPRLVDWAISARSPRLHVRERRPEAGGLVLVRLDRSASMGVAGKWPAALVVAGAFAWLGARAGARVQVAAAGAPALPLLRRAAEFARWAPALAALTATAEGATLGDPLAEELPRAPGGGGELVIIGDGFGDSLPPERLDAARARGWRLTVVQVLGADELAPAAGWQTFVDPESGATVELVVDQGVQDAYGRALAAHLEHLRRGVRARGAAHVVIDARGDVLAALGRALVEEAARR